MEAALVWFTVCGSRGKLWIFIELMLSRNIYFYCDFSLFSVFFQNEKLLLWFTAFVRGSLKQLNKQTVNVNYWGMSHIRSSITNESMWNVTVSSCNDNNLHNSTDLQHSLIHLGQNCSVHSSHRWFICSGLLTAGGSFNLIRLHPCWRNHSLPRTVEKIEWNWLNELWTFFIPETPGSFLHTVLSPHCVSELSTCCFFNNPTAFLSAFFFTLQNRLDVVFPTTFMI